MTKFTAGEFTVEISDPWPMWVTIRRACDNTELHHFRHTELVDLKHVIERTIAAAERRCPGETK